MQASTFINSIKNQALLLGQKFEIYVPYTWSLIKFKTLLKVATQYQMQKADSNKDSKDGSDDGKANQLFYIGSSKICSLQLLVLFVKNINLTPLDA